MASRWQRNCRAEESGTRVEVLCEARRHLETLGPGRFCVPRAVLPVVLGPVRIIWLLVVLGLLGAFTKPAWAGPSDREYPLDVDLGDRVDPVRPGQDIVYELEVENFTSDIAPDVVVVDELPPGTSFVVAHRQPDWEEVAAIIEGDRVRFELGDVVPCDQAQTPRCRDLWVVLRVDPGLTEGVRLTNRVEVSSSDASLPVNQAETVTTVSSAAIRKAKVGVGRPARDRVDARLDLARNGLYTPLDAPTAVIDFAGPLSLRVGQVGEDPLFAVDLPAGAIRCSDGGNPLRRIRCRLADKKQWKSMGMRKFDVFIPGYLAAQRNNVQLRVKLIGLTIAASIADEFEVVLVANGETFRDAIVLEPSKSGRVLKYSRSQGDP